MNQTKCQHILERIVTNHLSQMEAQEPRDYKILLYNYSLRFLRLSKRNEFAGEAMRRLYGVASELDGVDSKWREVSYQWKN